MDPSGTPAEYEPQYAAMLEELRAKILSSLPTIDAAVRAEVEEAGNIETRVTAFQKAEVLLRGVLDSDQLDASLAKCIVLQEATSAGLATFAARGTAQRKAVDTLLQNDRLLLHMAIADGARPIHNGYTGKEPARYGEAMEVYQQILAAEPKAALSDEGGILQRLAVAVALEYSEVEGDDAVQEGLQRFLHFRTARQDGELDPNFDRLTTWELRFVVCAKESNKELTWGREMLRNFRPDHISTTTNHAGRYSNVVTTDVAYGSSRVRYDRADLLGMQNILMNGGICGRRAFFARFICRAFGIPATPRPSTGHGATARWTPEGWIVTLGPGWGSGRTTTQYGHEDDLDFVAETQARLLGAPEFLKAKRAFWIGDVAGETRDFRETGSGKGFWNSVGLAVRRQSIDESDAATTLDAVGTQLGEASSTLAVEAIAAGALDNAANVQSGDPTTIIQIAEDGTINVPAASFHGTPEDVHPMRSHGQGTGLQVYLPHFSQQRPILCRGGSYKHNASLCQSATRHWRGRRPKKSPHMRASRLAVTPDGYEDNPKHLTLEVAKGVEMEFVFIPAGTFTMGGSRKVKEFVDILADTPRHEVTLSNGFYLGKYEVTKAQYRGIMEPDKQHEPTTTDHHPEDGMKPSNALILSETISAKIGLDVRLPTEAEWEYAARAGTDTLYHFGDDAEKLDDYAWYEANSTDDSTHPVGQKKPNPWGLYDMYGNVAEFVRDDHSDDYYANSPAIDPKGPSLGTFSEFEYAIEGVPSFGEYLLAATVVTNNPDQNLLVSVNGGPDATLAMPFTLGKWGSTEPIQVSLTDGKNTLRFRRANAPQYSVALKSFTLQPQGLAVAARRRAANSKTAATTTTSISNTRPRANNDNNYPNKRNDRTSAEEPTRGFLSCCFRSRSKQAGDNDKRDSKPEVKPDSGELLYAVCE